MEPGRRERLLNLAGSIQHFSSVVQKLKKQCQDKKAMPRIRAADAEVNEILRALGTTGQRSRKSGPARSLRRRKQLKMRNPGSRSARMTMMVTTRK